MSARFEDAIPDCADADLFDRLADGTLPEPERRRLLVRLETEPGGWRRCALAFLEAQSWREAFAPLTEAGATPAMAPATARAARTKPLRILVRRSAFAASLLAAVALGWMLRPMGAREVQLTRAQSELPGRAVSTTPPATDEGGRVWRTAPAQEPSETDPYLEAVVKSWERQGYMAERQKTVLTMKLADGREREIPAEEVRFHYAGKRTY